LSVFANSSGGRVFIGVDDSGRVVDTDISNAARSRVQDTINQIEPHLKVDIDINDNLILSFDKIIAEKKQKIPAHFLSKPSSCVYCRP